MLAYPMPMSDGDIQGILVSPNFNKTGARRVYLVRDDPDVVVKEAKNAWPGTNIMEWQIWSAIKDSDLADSFAECISISESGRYLIMEKLDPITDNDFINVPRLPRWWNDTKQDALAKTKSGFVKVLDYGLVSLKDTLVEAPREPWALSVAKCDPIKLKERQDVLAAEARERALRRCASSA